ncbi:helix-turn-helix domain-containing protein [Castellaniella sp.]|uniref:helix-turn-helix domain-containing protein n=1 Tax=Castellaniella sp. TaxID=1955812 RepID=UPI003C77C78A
MHIKELGSLVRERRRAVRLTQAQLASQTGISRATIAGLEAGSLAEIGFVKLQRICESVGLEMRAVQALQGRPTLDELVALNRQEYEQSHAKKPRFRS